MIECEIDGRVGLFFLVRSRFLIGYTGLFVEVVCFFSVGSYAVFVEDWLLRGYWCELKYFLLMS